LKSQENYPSIIYQQKNNTDFNINNFSTLAIVSSRETNAYGKRVIYKLLEELQGQNIVIVSGGAIGGDTFIHEAALINNLQTVSIIGAGLAHWYPKINISLFKKIINNNGVIMSHFPLDTTANKLTFPVRNSIIAGISQATLVIQAGLKSGTLITAHCALEYGKEVGAIPGYIDDVIMIESNNLIKQGAHCITCSNDILEMLNLIKIEGKTQNKERYSDCTEDQKKILNLCQEGLSLQELQTYCNITNDALYNELFLLMEKNYLMQDILGNWKTID
jgi:DNA processing protein